MIKQSQKPYEKEQVDNILNPLVKEWFYSKFKTYSLPQLHGVIPIHNRENILVSAPTGATKTLTSFLSILNELVDSAQKGLLEDRVYCVYISPLKALNNDIERNLLEPLREIEELYKKELGIRVAVRTGDTTSYQKSKMLKKPPHILITTPESLSIVLSSIKFRDTLKGISWCIIDEIHALAEGKRGVHLSLSIERLARLSDHMTRVGLSATVAPIDEVAKFLVGYNKDIPRDCTIVDVQFIKETDLEVISPLDNLIDTTPQKTHDSLYSLLDNLIDKHKSTLIFTNTRAATERVVDNLRARYPKKYSDNIQAHHGSLSKEHRLNVENSLRKGTLKCVVCSTSLELGIDIGFIDLVLMLSSPKSVARALQRAGRAGHSLHATTKARIIVLDRDDLIECAVLLKSAKEKKIDKIHIPTNCLDVLAQQIIGIALEEKIHIDDLLSMIRSSYCYNSLGAHDFRETIDYLSGKFVSLEDRHVYAKIWHDEDTGMIGKKGRMTRIIYMTNIGTIPDESFITVKIGNEIIGKLDESFLERLKPGDVFVLGGSTYQFKFTRGMVAQVTASVNRPPTVPRWASEMLPLSFDLSIQIGRFRRLMNEKLCSSTPKKEIMDFIQDYLYVKGKAANAIYEYFYEQYQYSKIPSDSNIIIERTKDPKGDVIVFHSLFGRRVNDCLSRAVAFAVSRTDHKDVEIGINDNGFYVSSESRIDIMKAFKRIKSSELRRVMEFAIDKTEVMKRRFRHCATRSLMILRNYKGRHKNVGRQQVGSMILMSALKEIDENFIILKEARREVLEDLMDIENTIKILKGIEEKKITITQTDNEIPSPFAFNLVMQGYTDILKMEDRLEFLKRMHTNVLAKISLNKDIDKDFLEKSYSKSPKDYDEIFSEIEEEKIKISEDIKDDLKFKLYNLEDIPFYMKEQIALLIDGKEAEDIRKDVFDAINEHASEIKKKWPKDLSKFVFEKLGIV